MYLSTKKALVQYRVLNFGFLNDPTVYKLLNNDSILEIINGIEEISFMNNYVCFEDKLDVKSFITLLDYLVQVFRVYFPTYYAPANAIGEILNANEELTRDYFLANYNDVGKSINKILDIKIYRLLISAFISNAKYVPEIREFLKEHDLELKDINDYSTEELIKIINLLSDLSFCKYGRGQSNALFDSIDYRIKYHYDLLASRNKVKNNEQFEEKAIKQVTQKYIELIKSYNSKRKYLKYFR